MRVISGRLRGHALIAPKGQGLRPTADLVKETLFNMLGGQVPAATFLDLFAGTGSIGIEALSRAAAQVVFVEKDPAYLRVLQRNLAACAVEARSRVYCGDANKILTVLRKEGWRFQFVYLDPPYRQTNMLRDLLRRLADSSLLADTATMIAEHAHTFIPPATLNAEISLTKQRRIGDTMLSFYGFRTTGIEI